MKTAVTPALVYMFWRLTPGHERSTHDQDSSTVVWENFAITAPISTSKVFNSHLIMSTCCL